MYCSTILKKKKKCIPPFVCSRNFSLLCLVLHFPSLSLFFVSPSALSFLQTQTPPNININITHHPPLLKLNRFTININSLILRSFFFSFFFLVSSKNAYKTSLQKCMIQYSTSILENLMPAYKFALHFPLLYYFILSNLYYSCLFLSPSPLLVSH